MPAHAEVDGTAIETTVQTCLASATTPEEARNCTFQGIDICASTQAGDAANPNQAREWCIRAGLQTWGEILDNEFRDAVNFAIDLDRPDNPLPDALRSAQASWVDFRTAHCRATFLFYELPSLQFVEEAACNLQMTADRAITLRAFRDGFTR
ncbi:MAG: lysozyme inhibitor LprI family protein [Pseudomonadota bacterium]